MRSLFSPFLSLFLVFLPAAALSLPSVPSCSQSIIDSFSPNELVIFNLLRNSPGKVFQCKELKEALPEKRMSDLSIKQYICEIKKKMGEKAFLITGLVKFGYRWLESDEQRAARHQRMLEEASNDLLVSEGITLDDYSKQVFINGNEVTLACREFALLRLFLREPGKIFSIEELATSLSDYDASSLSNGLYKLRKALGERMNRLQSLRGFGFSFKESEKPQSSLSPNIITLENLTFEPNKKEFRWNGEVLNLTPTQFKMFKALFQAYPNAVSLLDLADLTDGGEVNVRHHLSNIRKKFPKLAPYVIGVRRGGYQLQFRTQD